MPSLAKLVPLDAGRGNMVRSLWNRLHRLPGGRTLFSAVVGRYAPYTATIGAQVLELSERGSRVQLRDRPSVRNHLRCVHAVALVNLAELTGNVAVAYSLPDDARFIVAGLEIEYLVKARGTITASCTLEPIRTSVRREYDVRVTMHDPAGVQVAECRLRTLVGPKTA
ncbi:MAG: DUF4442 domain-containing protein [Myxococcota bacterium]